MDSTNAHHGVCGEKVLVPFARPTPTSNRRDLRPLVGSESCRRLGRQNRIDVLSRGSTHFSIANW